MARQAGSAAVEILTDASSGATGSWFHRSKFPGPCATAEFSGTVGGATLSVEASNDPDATPSTAVEISTGTAAGFQTLQTGKGEQYNWYRAKVTGGIASGMYCWII